MKIEANDLAQITAEFQHGDTGVGTPGLCGVNEPVPRSNNWLVADGDFRAGHKKAFLFAGRL
jgi:hypothetical protein